MTSLFAKMSQMVVAGRIGRQPFGIVSNNCWGAHIYQRAGLPFTTPFVGLFLPPEDYLLLVSDFHALVRAPLEFIDRSRHSYVNQLREGRGSLYPIGLLGGAVEIQFLHYRDHIEAREKWTRRVERLPTDDSRLFFKFCDRDGCTLDQLRAFMSLPWKNKVCFSASAHDSLGTVVIPGCHGEQVPDGLALSRFSGRYFDSLAWITGAPTPWPVRRFFPL